MFGPRARAGVLRRSDVVETTRMRRLDVEHGPPRAVALTRAPAMARWIAAELRPTELELTTVASVDAVLAALVGGPPPHAELLIVDLDPLDAASTFELHALRARGWFGVIIALGSAAPDLQVSLAIHRALPRPLREGALGLAVDELGLHEPTLPVSIMPRSHPR